MTSLTYEKGSVSFPDKKGSAAWSICQKKLPIFFYYILIGNKFSSALMLDEMPEKMNFKLVPDFKGKVVNGRTGQIIFSAYSFYRIF